MKSTIKIQNEERVVKAINQFCFTISALAFICVFVYFFFGYYLVSGILSIISLVFLGLVYLNKKSTHSVSRFTIILVTNLSVLAFLGFLGFTSGVYLYLFAAPLLTYLLYDFNQKKVIYLCFTSYFITFVLAYIIDKAHWVKCIPIETQTLGLIFAINFAFTFLLCIILTIYFAFNNSAYTKMLIATNLQLEENQKELKTEIQEKNKKQEELKSALKEKEILLSEIHHRVKNNLAVISGLVELQNFYVKDEKASAILKESRNRIKSIALLHEKFYESKSLEKIEIRSYIDELIYFIKLSFSTQHKEIKIHTQIDFIELSLEDALPFSLLLNELITNSYKHAFPGKETGNIYISFIRKSNEFVFHFKDDGVGFVFSDEAKEKTLGLNLIEAFAKQLKGELIYTSEKNTGTELVLHFKL